MNNDKSIKEWQENILALINTFSELSPENKTKILSRVNEVIGSLLDEPELQKFFIHLYECLEGMK